jgi:hypothetical protein
MKKTTLRNGVIAGAIVSVLMTGSLALGLDQINNGLALAVGYASMLIAFVFVFVAIKTFRDRENGGAISFGQAFRIGLFVSLIASTFYVAAWLVEFYCFIPDFMDKYAAHAIAEMRADGRSAAEIAAKAAEMSKMREMYKSPVMVIIITYAEILPVGLIAALIAAAVYRKPKTATATKN